VVLGARRSALIGLKWRDVDLGAGEVLIASGVVRVAGQPVTGARLAEAAGVSASDGRALLAELRADPTSRARATGSGPAPPAATTWRASGASSPPCCARPPPPAFP
jgi:hypothetical protein